MFGLSDNLYRFNSLIESNINSVSFSLSFFRNFFDFPQWGVSSITASISETFFYLERITVTCSIRHFKTLAKYGQQYLFYEYHLWLDLHLFIDLSNNSNVFPAALASLINLMIITSTCSGITTQGNKTIFRKVK
jgi:hypothetical protein